MFKVGDSIRRINKDFNGVSIGDICVVEQVLPRKMLRIKDGSYIYDANYFEAIKPEIKYEVVKPFSIIDLLRAGFDVKLCADLLEGGWVGSTKIRFINIILGNLILRDNLKELEELGFIKNSDEILKPGMELDFSPGSGYKYSVAESGDGAKFNRLSIIVDRGTHLLVWDRGRTFPEGTTISELNETLKGKFSIVK